MRSRRRFIIESTVLAAGAVVAPGLAADYAPRVAPSDLGLEVFAGLISQRFRTNSVGGRAIELELAAADAVPAAHGEQFVLVFRGPPDCPLEQDTYWFEQEKLGRFPMFIVPAFSSGSPAASYVAVFNRLGKDPAAQVNGGVCAI